MLFCEQTNQPWMIDSRERVSLSAKSPKTRACSKRKIFNEVDLAEVIDTRPSMYDASIGVTMAADNKIQSIIVTAMTTTSRARARVRFSCRGEAVD